MRSFGARIFSKSFGGKIKHGQTDVDKETTFTKENWHNTVLEYSFFTRIINIWESSDFTEFNIVFVKAIWN